MTVDEMAGEVERPARVLNAHWLNQAYLVPLVELSPGVRTDGAILAKAEIATITGHGLRDLRSILDAHYLHRDRALAESGIRELEMGYAQRLAEVKAGTDSTKWPTKQSTESCSKRRKRLIGSIGWGTRIRT